MSHPGGGGGTGPGGGGGTGPGRGTLRAIDDGLASLIAVAVRSLPAPADDAQEVGQACLVLRLQSAREAVADLLNAPARRDSSSAAVGADANRYTRRAGHHPRPAR
jgi:hypothetical protein